MGDRITTPFTADSTASDVLRGVRLHGRRYLVTGGASGIGAETALALALAGADVVVAVRDVAAASAWARGVSGVPGRVQIEHADLADLDSVAALASRWSGALDGLVANAGVMAFPELRRASNGWELQLATNFLGHFALAHALRESLAIARGRVVIVSSAAHRSHPFDFTDPQFEREAYDRWAAYGRSKSADVLFAVGIARRWKADGITANALMPGWITTPLQRHLDQATLRSMGAVDEAGDRIEQPYYKTPAQGASTSVLLAASPLIEGVTGRYFEDNQEAVVGEGVAPHALIPEDAERLWRLGEAALGRDAHPRRRTGAQ